MPQKCPQCGASLPAGALAGLCPACLLQQGAAADTATRPEAKPFVPLPVEEVARLFPQLEILGFLGKGGMGAVYKARQPALDRLVALKILPAQTAPDPGFAERFTREARALARLSHPNIVAVHEFGQVSQRSAGVPPAPDPSRLGTAGVASEPPVGAGGTPALPYFIMEFVDGVNLRQLEKAGRLSPREALQIIPQICDALQYAHDEGVVHRDIKPENILVDRRGRMKIADFGLAKIITGRDASPRRPGDDRRTAGPAVPTHLTEAGQVMGTPHYMAPEQIEHPQAVDHRADIFSLGVVFYEMLTGELPLGKFQPPSHKVQVDVRLDEVVLHALEKEPERRYQHASEVKTDVQTITHPAPPKANSLGAPLSLTSPGDRRGAGRRKVALLTALALLLLLGFSALLLCLCLPATNGTPMPPGLIGWWRGDGNANDSAGTNNAYSLPYVHFTGGIVGQAFSFDPENLPYGRYSGVRIADQPYYALTNSLSIEGWIRPRGDGYTIFYRGDNRPGLDPYTMSMALNNILSFGITDADGDSASVSAPILYNQWWHVAGTLDGASGKLSLYTNGALAAQITTTVRPLGDLIPEDSPGIGIGNVNDGFNNFPFQGDIDEVSLYNRALSASEIHAIFAAGHRGKQKPGHWLSAMLHLLERPLEPGQSGPVGGIAPPPGLVSWWRGEGDGSDSAGTNNGVLHGGVAFVAREVGQAFSFNGGSDSYVEVADSPTLRFPNALTIECWAKRLNTSECHELVEKGGTWNGGQTDFGIGLNDTYSGGSHFGFSFAGGWRGCAVTPDTEWHHYAAVAVSGQANPILYIDGVPQTITFQGGPATMNLSASTRPLHIGAVVDPQTGWFKYSSTMIDELAIYNRALSASEIQAIFAAGPAGKRKPRQGLWAIFSALERQLEPGRSRPVGAIAPPPGLVGWWRGEGNAKDSAGANNGTLLGEATFAPGKVGQAFSFDPESGTVVVPDSSSLQLTNELTIEAWINARSLSGPGGYAIVSKLGIATGNNGYQFLVVGDTLQGLFNSPGLSWPSQRIISGPLLSPGVWYHAAFTYDQSAMKLYRNGQLVTTKVIGAKDIATSTSDLRISGADDHCFFDGLIDEVAVYSRALSAAEIEANYAADQNGKRTARRGMLGALREGTGLPEDSGSAASPPSALPNAWSPTVEPGRKLDPNKVRDEANELRAKGEYQAALDRFLWYWNHALEYDPNLSAVRLSFLLSDWVELGRRYPRAEQALLDTRTRDTQMLLNKRGDFDLFMELASLNQYLQEEEATYEVFNKLRQRDPALAWQCFFVAQPLLVKHGDYALCLEYLGDSEAAFSRIRQQWQMRKQQEQRGEGISVQTPDTKAGSHPQTPPKMADGRFVDETCQLILILVKTEHKTEAEHIRDEALGLIDDPRLKSAVSDAEREPAGK
jgi:serine/threonine protein kinase